MIDYPLCELIAILEWKYTIVSSREKFFDYLEHRPIEIYMEALDEISEIRFS
jgi:hypothetical protein